jgi:hypothetical protein
LDEFAGFRGVENLVITDERAPVSVIRRFHMVENGEQDRGVLQAGKQPYHCRRCALRMGPFC